MQYCNSLTGYSRFLTREVKAGHIGIGASNPIRIQSMTTTDTMDTKGTVEQAVRIIEAGGELVRVTAPSLNDAKNLELIKRELRTRGYDTPLVADIHFTPNAAEYAARVVEKVRINPGNYADKKKFQHFEYSESAYQSELDRIRKRFIPLVKICREYGTAMRIGTNHGSLSDRILSRYGDTPLGMVESAMEFVRICEDEGYFNIVLSMKASNPQVMVQAYRLLAARMIASGQHYPLHLGVTEAGDGEDGRIKSAAGIGTLLEDGLGDTIRVSLTEEPEAEIPVAIALASRYETRNTEIITLPAGTAIPVTYTPFEFNRRKSREVAVIGGTNVPRVIADLSGSKITPASLFSTGYRYSVKLDKWNVNDNACDFIYTGDHPVTFETPGTLGVIHNHTLWLNEKHRERRYPLFLSPEEYSNLSDARHPSLNFIIVDDGGQDWVLPEQILQDPAVVLLAKTRKENKMSALRQLFLQLGQKYDIPVIPLLEYSHLKKEELQLYAAADAGGLFIDGFGDGLWVCEEKVPTSEINNITFNILQATRSRISKTEYISCPSCGRTLFDLQETTAKIRARTSHLKGVKIGIMGCIVNGPGEMADADYGYVGTGPGKITLYKGKEVVRRNIPSSEAVDQLIDLIREHGDWVETSVAD